MEYGAVGASYAQVRALNGSTVVLSANYTISGGGGYHLRSLSSSTIADSGAITAPSLERLHVEPELPVCLATGRAILNAAGAVDQDARISWHPVLERSRRLPSQTSSRAYPS